MPVCLGNHVVSIILDSHTPVIEDAVATAAVITSSAVRGRGPDVPPEPLGLPVHRVQQLRLKRLALLEQDNVSFRLGHPLLGSLPRIGIRTVNGPVTMFLPVFIVSRSRALKVYCTPNRTLLAS